MNLADARSLGLTKCVGCNSWVSIKDLPREHRSGRLCSTCMGPSPAAVVLMRALSKHVVHSKPAKVQRLIH